MGISRATNYTSGFISFAGVSQHSLHYSYCDIKPISRYLKRFRGTSPARFHPCLLALGGLALGLRSFRPGSLRFLLPPGRPQDRAARAHSRWRCLDVDATNPAVAHRMRQRAKRSMKMFDPPTLDLKIGSMVLF